MEPGRDEVRAPTAGELGAEPLPKKHGFDHLFAATGYSAGGLAVLWRQTAFRHELVGGGLALALHVLFGTAPLAILGQLILLFVLFATEALNTAIEHVVDRLSPEISIFAKETKDLGSAAVFFILCANGLYFLVAAFLAF
ncbi:diacylglycerol kinase [Fulvimarina manganoxydans]|uniref:Diacylglycerol kinase n=1 Tax=Fulvimarina manganoxydans TaxID=937218 RepID=A0A1W2AK20_9HYPH|nr:diacylglycerol kinase [Fulvimarina manganoxydans]SMC61045.1 diacylglycerol kinase [Fulvimarina manganoxydans]